MFLGFHYIKVPPSYYVMHYSGGKLIRAGVGLAFFILQTISLAGDHPHCKRRYPLYFQ